MNSALSDSVLKSLANVVGNRYVHTDPNTLEDLGVDRTRFWQPAPVAAVRPESVEQLQAIVKLANQHQLALVPSGGRTGLSGGAVAANGELVVALDRMNRILDLDTTDRTLRCQAGVITRQVQDAAEQHGLFYPVDFASSGSSQIGGNIATNAGGIKVIRYGMTRNWVRGLTVVTGAGDVLELNHGLVKNNAGYNLQQLFIGSEGTLGFIAEATLQLTRPPKSLQVMVLAMRDLPAVLEVLKVFSRAVELTAFEFFTERGLQIVVEEGSSRPFATVAPCYVLLEFDAVYELDQHHAEAAFSECLDQGLIVDGVASQSVAQAKALWCLREDLPERLHRYQPYKSDLSVRVSRLPGFVADIERLVTDMDRRFEVVLFGHIGDGNIHVNILKPDEMTTEQFARHSEVIGDELARLVSRYEGSVSAEHGIGLLKKASLGYCCSETEIDLMKQLKQVFDPNGIMNPGKLFD
ncbi:FAD-binding oxidoreductase [Porticoccaceae bacterium LTM1]|nr:FAD-binding oxidoreductase [Porticoccaceae bacterium LTM1]